MHCSVSVDDASKKIKSASSQDKRWRLLRDWSGPGSTQRRKICTAQSRASLGRRTGSQRHTWRVRRTSTATSPPTSFGAGRKTLTRPTTTRARTTPGARTVTRSASPRWRHSCGYQSKPKCRATSDFVPKKARCAVVRGKTNEDAGKLEKVCVSGKEPRAEDGPPCSGTSDR